MLDLNNFSLSRAFSFMHGWRKTKYRPGYVDKSDL